MVVGIGPIGVRLPGCGARRCRVIGVVLALITRCLRIIRWLSLRITQRRSRTVAH